MKFKCPKDPEHKTFVTTAHVSEDWIVDECGNFIESAGVQEVIADPNPENTWQCNECGAEAVRVD